MPIALDPKATEDFKIAVEKEVSSVASDRREILRNIVREAFKPLSPTEESERASRTLSKFSVLLVALSEQADRVQRWMVILTVAITVM